MFVGLFLAVSTPVVACMGASCDVCWSSGCASCTTSGNTVNCFDCGQQEMIIPEGPQTDVTFLRGNQVRVKVQGYETTQLEPTTECVTAFPPIESVASVDSIVNYDGSTGLPFTEVEFYASDEPGWAVARLAEKEGIGPGNTRWHSFRSHITGTVEDGVPNYFVIQLTLKEGTDPLDFIEDLKAAGSFLTSGSNEDGAPIHHSFFRQFGFGRIVASQPYRLLDSLGLPGFLLQSPDERPANF